MDLILTNRCQRNYKPDQVGLTKKIIERIPGKFLIGLHEILFYDNSSNPVVKYDIGDKKSRLPCFHIYMGGFSKNYKFSRFHYNLLLNGLITSHIVKFLQPRSNDPEILSIRPSRINHPEWLSFGVWTPFVKLLSFFRIVFKKSPYTQRLFKKGIDSIESDLEKIRDNSKK